MVEALLRPHIKWSLLNLMRASQEAVKGIYLRGQLGDVIVTQQSHGNHIVA